MQTISLEQAQSELTKIISQLGVDDELIITDHDLPVARLLPIGGSAQQPRKPGSAIGLLTIVEDDDEHLADFREYMP